MNVQERVNAYLDYCEYRKELDEKTLKAYRIDLRQFFEFVQLLQPEKDRIEEYITGLHKKYKQKTVKRKLASIKAFYNYLEEEEILEVNPFRKIRVKFKETVNLPRIIPRNEIECLLNHMYRCLSHTPNDRFLLRDLAVVEVFFATGARVCEISSIRLDCMDLNSGLIRIMGKGGKERYVQIGEPEIMDLLHRYYTENESAIRQSGFFFINQRGSRYTEQSIRLMIQKYTKASGIDRHITPHMFRHSFATYLIEEGVDVSCVQRILGHSSIKTTQIYIHIAARTQAEILKMKHPRKRMKIITAA